jgi:hypothetical protein
MLQHCNPCWLPAWAWTACMHNPTAGCVNAVCDPSQDELFSSMMLLANYALQVTWLPAWAWTAETCLRVPPPPKCTAAGCSCSTSEAIINRSEHHAADRCCQLQAIWPRAWAWTAVMRWRCTASCEAVNTPFNGSGSRLTSKCLIAQRFTCCHLQVTWLPVWAWTAVMCWR